MKRLHRMIIGLFLGPLSVTFVIVLFILLMQFVWKYVDDLMGKGLEWHVLMELLFYAGASFVPLALPLAILLSSIMTMGGLGENSELVPLRSAGMHLFRIMLPLVIFVGALGLCSFIFSNNVLPVANLKFQSLLWDVTKKKPALNLQPGVFYNGIDGFSIRVKDKDADTGELTDVLIYDHREAFQGNRTVIRAKSGRMLRSTAGDALVLSLTDIHFYDERPPGREQRSIAPLVRGTSAQEMIRLDLSGLGMARTDEDLFRDHYKMLTMGQLQFALDSLKMHFAHRNQEQAQQVRKGIRLFRDSIKAQVDTSLMIADNKDFLATLPRSTRRETFELAMNMARNQINFLDRTMEENKGRNEQISRFEVEWHRKLMLAAACIIFFFIGAPLGSIIRKGGLGLPTVFAIVFFLIFHILSFSAERLVVAGNLSAWPGMWISSFVLLPIGIYLTIKAASDSPLLDRDAYYRAWERLTARLGRRSHEDPTTVP